MNWDESSLGLLTALSIGFLIGTVRERLHRPGAMKAGVRTHVIVALTGAITFGMGTPFFITALLVTGFMMAIGYRQSAPKDPGMTGEFTLFLTMVLAGQATTQASRAAATGVVVAGLLLVKKPLRKFSQEILTEHELEDALMLFASALVVLPLLPTAPIDPWYALNPYAIWKIVVLIMGVGMLGHVCMRVAGVRWGLPLAGFFSGFISSTAAVAEYGHKAHDKPAFESMASAAALLSVLSSLMLFTLVLAASAPELLRSVAWPLVAAGIALSLVAAYFIQHTEITDSFQLTSAKHAFKTTHALTIATTISAVILCAAWLKSYFGDSGAFATSVIVGLVEIHAAAVGISQLSHSDLAQSAFARWGVIAILASSAMSKIFLAYFIGGLRYGHRIAIGLASLLGAAILCMLGLGG